MPILWPIQASSTAGLGMGSEMIGWTIDSRECSVCVTGVTDSKGTTHLYSLALEQGPCPGSGWLCWALHPVVLCEEMMYWVCPGFFAQNLGRAAMSTCSVYPGF